MPRGFAGILIIPTLAACTASLSPEAKAVRLTANPEMVRGCRLIGPVEGGGGKFANTIYKGSAEKNALAEIRNRAARQGANTVLLIPGATTNKAGEAYQCEVNP